MQVPIIRPYIGEEEIEAVRKVLESGWLIQGAKVEEFEGMVAELVGAKYAKACSSCTTALHMSLLALNVGPGDEVLVPAYTFVASWNAIEYTGATPVGVDIDLPTFNMDRTPMWNVLRHHPYAKTVMPVHLFGLCADVGSILSRLPDMKVVEDAACALGSVSPEGNAGVCGDASCFSFHPRKPIATGEGGMVTTSDKDIADKIHALRDFGFTVTNLDRHKQGATIMPEVNVLGYNFRLTDIQAAIGVEQMKKFPWIVEQKQRRAAIYDSELGRLDWLHTPYVPEGYVHTYQSYACLVGSLPVNFSVEDVEGQREIRDRVMGILKEKGVATRQGTHAVHMLGYYEGRYGYKPMDFPMTYAADAMCITIPLFPHMTDDEQQYVIDCIKNIEI